ncbi:MAG: MerR family transcriptional regulator [Methylotenera sp.]|uniref:MerR family transcriptional regulator n=1 Tax=Methylotenera sp. TaxID=2051956 RepID=UPI001818CE4F|nr:MerR family transcriptional regulator [Methylotenera sp.]NOU24923.1 MerR family transcriptional regulator [Methylotenera sp.]
MSEPITKAQLPPIPAKRYFTIGEVSELCGVKPHVLRYWEQEFTQLKPVKRRGNRRYYQHHEVLLIRRIRELLYEQGFTISGARNRLDGPDEAEIKADAGQTTAQLDSALNASATSKNKDFDFNLVKTELLEILNLLRPSLSASK